MTGTTMVFSSAFYAPTSTTISVARTQQSGSTVRTCHAKKKLPDASVSQLSFMYHAVLVCVILGRLGSGTRVVSTSIVVLLHSLTFLHCHLLMTLLTPCLIFPSIFDVQDGREVVVHVAMFLERFTRYSYALLLVLLHIPLDTSPCFVAIGSSICITGLPHPSSFYCCILPVGALECATSAVQHEGDKAKLRNETSEILTSSHRGSDSPVNHVACQRVRHLEAP